MEMLHPQVGFDADVVVLPPPATDEYYDEIPYGSHPIAVSHPDRLYNNAKFLNLSPTPPEEARILEIGCAGGGNLIPVAAQFPNSRCVGVELSKVQVDNARIAIDYCGLNNIEIRQGSIVDLAPELGKFDYIICHGVYSWVPDFVREGILKVASQNLNENGVAYISYNTFPGWHFRGMLREMMLRHVEDIDNNRTKVVQARALLDFISVVTKHDNSPHAAYIRGEATKINSCPDEYIAHEYLEKINQPFYFKDFMRDASRHGLQYLNESRISSTWLGIVSAEAAAKLGTIPDPVLRGHYMDCLTGRSFRETLLVPKEVPVSRHPTRERFSEARFAGYFKQDNTQQKLSASERIFKVNEKTIRTADRFAHAIIDSLNECYPASIDYRSLLESTRAKLRASDGQAEFEDERFHNELVAWSIMELVKFQFHPDRAGFKKLSKPCTTVWARAQAEAGTLVTTLAHRMQVLSETQRQMMPLLNGLNSVQEIAANVEVLIRTGVITVDSRHEREKDTPQFALDLTLKNLGPIASAHLILP